jgi:hypothetical protein
MRFSGKRSRLAFITSIVGAVLNAAIDMELGTVIATDLAE